MGFRDYSGKLKSIFLRHSLELQTDNVFKRQFLYARNFINGKNSILLLFFIHDVDDIWINGQFIEDRDKTQTNRENRGRTAINLKKNPVMFYTDHTL